MICCGPTCGVTIFADTETIVGRHASCHEMPRLSQCHAFCVICLLIKGREWAAECVSARCVGRCGKVGGGGGGWRAFLHRNYFRGNNIQRNTSHSSTECLYSLLFEQALRLKTYCAKADRGSVVEQNHRGPSVGDINITGMPNMQPVHKQGSQAEHSDVPPFSTNLQTWHHQTSSSLSLTIISLPPTLAASRPALFQQYKPAPPYLVP